MYEAYWGLKGLPFENVPDPKFFYATAEYEEALVRMNYAVSRRKGAAMLTGEVGCGKTLLSRIFIQNLPNDSYEVALITNPAMSPLDFIKEVVCQFGIETKSSSKSELLQILNTTLLKNMEQEKNSTLIIDEAQAIEDVNTFEELRLLLNFQLNDCFLLTLIFLGQPELKEQVRKIPQLDQRIAMKYHLRPLDLDSVSKYISFRLGKVGAEKAIFSQKAVEYVYQFTQGIPRKINNLCDLALLVGSSSKMKMIEEPIILKLIDEFR
ncbi:MAG: AAA family ATPase [Candidatus Tectomicrobia bacterium]|uniref:AAA family ATPase n=1 Tax=Tectimicrobiota bacterium TaxID=2528274 RepID=A0A933GJW2_UNCTE|nr:AAA family ATPase [Candidatus Tectomicrobia bacterium]